MRRSQKWFVSFRPTRVRVVQRRCRKRAQRVRPVGTARSAWSRRLSSERGREADVAFAGERAQYVTGAASTGARFCTFRVARHGSRATHDAHMRKFVIALLACVAVGTANADERNPLD